MATKKQRFRTACKVSSVSSAGYCVATASDNLSSDEVTISVYSQTLCSDVFKEIISGNELKTIIEDLSGRNSNDKTERDGFYSRLLENFVKLKETSSTDDGGISVHPPVRPPPPPPPPPSQEPLDEPGSSILHDSIASARSSFDESRFQDCVDCCIYAVKVRAEDWRSEVREGRRIEGAEERSDNYILL